ncbi:MAG TPA: DUF1540 domain-containing protein [Desulfotomaculum sp.]|nr:MAG: Uncharacterized protein XD78_2127 [Desulfotomaculum sp. 46_296]HAG12228.1 DUF1540 domain-containing protein [Desulfotomaculum sp.]HBY05265.1 DUF1540 domain-containing protein [Desulfotomaculum sp.]
MDQHIHCLVNDCHYWNQGNMCKANEILVTSDSFSSNQPDTVDAAMTKQLSPTPAGGTCMSTCCKTYATKDSGGSKVDGVKRML